jgi:hypothetical protein
VDLVGSGQRVVETGLATHLEDLHDHLTAIHRVGGLGRRRSVLVVGR